MAEDIRPGLIADAIGGSGGSADEVRRKLLLAMLQQGTSGEPVQHWAQGLDRVGKALLGSWELRDLDRADAVDRKKLLDDPRLWAPDDPRLQSAPSAASPAPSPQRPLPRASLLPNVDPEPRRAPVGTFPDPRGTVTSIDGQPYVSAGMRRAADTELAQGLGAGQQGAVEPVPPGMPGDVSPVASRFGSFGGQPAGADPTAPMVPNAVRTVSFPRQPPEQAFTGSQGPAGAAPPGMPPVPAVPPNMLPAPRESQVAQAPGQVSGAPGQRSVPQIPEVMRKRAIDLLSSRNPKLQAEGRKILDQFGGPVEFKFQVAGDKLYRMNPRTGGAEEIADAQKDPEAVRTATRMMQSPQQFGYSGANDPRLHRDIQYRLSGLQAPDASFSKEAAGVLSKRYGALVELGTQAQEQVANIQSLRDIGSRITTGKSAEVIAALGPWAEMVGVKIENLPDAQAYNAIVAKMAPLMRVPGSGAQSDFELRQFLQSLPGLGKTPQGNEIISRTLEAIAEHRMAVANIGTRVLTEQMTPQAAEKAIRELPNPLALWKQSRPGQSPTSAGGAPSGMPRYNLETGKIER